MHTTLQTELCKALAGFLFNDEQRGLYVFPFGASLNTDGYSRININMSEYHDRHTISRLIGAAPGYVGFEEGGMDVMMLGLYFFLTDGSNPYKVSSPRR